jgi:hypothetical protein
MLCSVKQAAQKHYKRIALAQHGPADPFVHKVPPVYSSEGSKRNVHTALRTIEYTALCTVFLSIQEYCTQRRDGRKGEGSNGTRAPASAESYSRLYAPPCAMYSSYALSEAAQNADLLLCTALPAYWNRWYMPDI